MYNPNPENPRNEISNNKLDYNFTHVDVKANTILEVSMKPYNCTTPDTDNTKKVNLHIGRSYTFKHYMNGMLHSTSGIIDAFYDYAGHSFTDNRKSIKVIDRKHNVTYIDTRTIQDIVAHDKEVRILVVGISAEILKSVVVRLAIMDDHPDESIIYVDLKVDDLYAVTWMDNKSNKINHTYGKLTEIKEVHQHWHGGSNQYVRFDNQVPGMGNLPFQEPPFGKKETVYDIALTFDVSLTDTPELVRVYLSDIRNCSQIDELPKPFPTILPFNYALEQKYYGADLIMTGEDIEKVAIVLGNIDEDDTIDLTDILFIINSWDGKSPVNLVLLNSKGLEYTIVVSFNDKYKNEVQYIHINIGEEQEPIIPDPDEGDGEDNTETPVDP